MVKINRTEGSKLTAHQLRLGLILPSLFFVKEGVKIMIHFAIQSILD